MARSSSSRTPRPPRANHLHAAGRLLLDHLLPAPSRVVRLAWAFLLLVALGRGTFARVLRLHYPGSPTYPRRGLATLLQAFDARTWEAALNAVLLALSQPALRRGPVLLVGDETKIPYWGRAPGDLQSALRRGPPQQGTTRFFTYVTLCALGPGYRLPLALGWQRADESVAQVCARLLPPLRAAGLRVETALWDRGGANVALLDALGQAGFRFLVAAPRRGPVNGVDAALTKLEQTHGARRERPPRAEFQHTLRPEKGRGLAPLDVRVLVDWEPVEAPPDARRQRGAPRRVPPPDQRWRALAWFTNPTEGVPLSTAHSLYQRRASIECSYRQSECCRGRTSSNNGVYRLLLFALSQILQALATVDDLEAAAAQREGSREAPRWFVDRLKLGELAGIRWLAAWMRRKSKPQRAAWVGLG